MQNTEGRAPKADVISFNTAISACEKASAWQIAMLLFLEMENSKYLSPKRRGVKLLFCYFKSVACFGS